MKISEPNPAYFLANNIPVANLINDGYQIVYERLFSHKTTGGEIDLIAATCNSNTILCAGGRNINSQILILVSCGNCLKITKETVLNNPVLESNAYWYRTALKSFGFSPNRNITQNIADQFDVKSNLRLSWHLDELHGGWRLGNITLLNDNNQYLKILFKR